MPTYIYKCKTNGHVFEKRQKFTDDALTECVVCGDPVRKVINNVGVVFKGKGFYVTDNRSNNSAAPKTTSNGKSESDSSGSSSDSGGESTSKASSESKSEKAPATSSSAES